MELLTAEQVAKCADELNGIANIRKINKMFRDQDDSHLWPISGRFNATERAIRKARQFQRESGIAMYGLEYALMIDNMISEIVNNSCNW